MGNSVAAKRLDLARTDCVGGYDECNHLCKLLRCKLLLMSIVRWMVYGGDRARHEGRPVHCVKGMAPSQTFQLDEFDLLTVHRRGDPDHRHIAQPSVGVQQVLNLTQDVKS